MQDFHENIVNQWLEFVNNKNTDGLVNLYDSDNASHKSIRKEYQEPTTRGIITGSVDIRNWWNRVFTRLPSLQYRKRIIVYNANTTTATLSCFRVIADDEIVNQQVRFIFSNDKIVSTQMLNNTKILIPSQMPENYENLNFYFINIKEALEAYINTDFTSPNEGDSFFQEFCPGNTVEVINAPYERFNDYENLLLLLVKTDESKFEQIHKGTPYYFMAWISYYMKTYERAVFYMDAAISEDIRKTIYAYRQKKPGETRNDSELSNVLIHDALACPAGHFILLRPAGNQAAMNITRKLRGIWENEIIRFNTTFGVNITVDNIVDKFFMELASNTETRSILTALNSFILENEDIYSLIKLRSSYGGSIEPIITYLLKGGLIFESILKNLYPLKDNRNPTKTIGDIARVADFQYKYLNNLTTSASTLNEILQGITNDSLNTAFNTTAKIRNTTGHNLKWDDIFNDSNNFKILFAQIVNAVLWIYLKSYD